MQKIKISLFKDVIIFLYIKITSFNKNDKNIKSLHKNNKDT